MKKLYENKEITFAVLTIVVYVVSMGTLRNLGDDSPWMTLGLLLFCAALLLFVKKNALMEKYGLSAWARNSRAMLWFIPLWIIASCNLWNGVSVKYPFPGQAFAVLSMALVGVAEEVVFRGFLFKAMLKNDSARSAILVSSITFGMGHIVNLLTGHDLSETLAQIAFAVAVGFVLTMAFYKSGSLLPNILMHSAVDVLSLFAGNGGQKWMNWGTHAFIIVMAAAYCLYLARCVETPEVNRMGASCPD